MLMLILQNPLATDKQLYFNTSHVNVNRLIPKEFGGGYIFQYISC